MCLRSLSYSACIDHATYYTAICSLSGFTIYFTHYFTEGTIFRKRFIQQKIRVLFSSAHFGKAFLVLRRIRPDITTNAHTAYCNVTVILIRVYKTWILTTVIHLSNQFLTVVAVFRKPNAILLCFCIDLDLNFVVVIAAWTPFIHVFVDVLFSFSPVVSNP